MNPTAPITDADLHAFVDGQLPPERQQAVQAHLLTHPEDASKVAVYSAQNAGIRAHYQPVLDERIPTRLRQAATAKNSKPARHIAAAVALMAISGATGWQLKAMQDEKVWSHTTLESRSPSSGDPGLAPFARRAAIAHAVFTPEVKHPVEVDAEHEDHLVSWLSKRLGRPIKAPHLQAMGYALEGGRLLPGGQGPVAQFMYRDGSGHRLTLYVSDEPHVTGREDGDTAFRFSQEGDINVLYWVDEHFGYAISAQLGRASLAKLSSEVYAQLSQARP
jgi:anti-sigma factor RsiW